MKTSGALLQECHVEVPGEVQLVPVVPVTEPDEETITTMANARSGR